MGGGGGGVVVVGVGGWGVGGGVGGGGGVIFIEWVPSPGEVVMNDVEKIGRYTYNNIRMSLNMRLRHVTWIALIVDFCEIVFPKLM